VRSDQVLPLGMRVVIDLVRPGIKKAIRLSGEVVSNQTTAMGKVPGMGVRFDAPSPELAERLHGLLRELGAAESTPDSGFEQPRPGKSLSAPNLAPVFLKAPAPAPVPIPVPPPAPAPAGPDANDVSVHITGLLMQLSDTQTELRDQQEQIRALRAEVMRLRHMLAVSDEQLERIREIVIPKIDLP